MLLVFLASVALAAPAAAESATGSWHLSVEWPQGARDVTLTVSESDGGLTATWKGPRGQLEAEEVRFAENRLTFVLTAQGQQGEEVRLRFEGTVAGNELEGKLVTPRDRELPVSGRRDE